MTQRTSRLLSGDGHYTRQRQQAVAAMARASVWWRARTPREQVLLRFGAAITGIALLWAVGIEPAVESIRRSQQRLPQLRADAAQIDAFILEAQALQRRQSGRMTSEDIAQGLEAGLRRSGLTATATVVPSSNAPSHWQVSFNDAAAARVMEWLAELPAILHVRVVSVELARSQVEGRDRPGHVSGRIVLQPPEALSP